MVVKIQKSHPVMKGTLSYNENKVRKGVAFVIGTNKMETGNPSETEKVFGLLERANICTKKISFQMTINPNPENPSEKYSDDKLNSLAYELMKGLGYGDQPYVIYRHQDIDRTHYHIVSCRVNKDGRKINDKFEKERLQRLMQKLRVEYAFEIGDKKGRTKAKEEQSGKRSVTALASAPTGPVDNDGFLPMPDLTDEPIPIRTDQQANIPEKIAFDNKKTKVAEQYTRVLREALTYKFSSYNQFKSICESYNVTLSSYVDSEGEHLSAQGLDENGERSRGLITEKQLGEAFHKAMSERIEASTKKEEASAIKSSSKPDRARVGRMASFFLGISKNQAHFERMLAKKNIFVSFSYNVNGELFGATFVDRQSKSAFKASELVPSLRTEQVKQQAEKWITNEQLKAEKKAYYAQRKQIRQDTLLFKAEAGLREDEAREMRALASDSWVEVLTRPIKKINKLIK